MMQPFDTLTEGISATTWLRRNATGNCSILMLTAAGTTVYMYWHDNPAGPMIYGPVGFRDESGKTRRLYRELPELSEGRILMSGQFIKGNWVPDRCWLGPETFERVSQRQARFEVMERALTNLLHDLRILSGEIVGPSGVGWQDVAGTAAVNAQVLADQITQARAGNSHGPVTFPSPSECLEGKEQA